jgi:hypothetical protein
MLAASAAGARADDTSECIAKMRSDLDAFNGCAIPKVKVKAQGTDAPEAIAESVIGDCQARIDALKITLHAAPCSQNDDQTDQVVGTVLTQAKEDFSKAAIKFRGQ